MRNRCQNYRFVHIGRALAAALVFFTCTDGQGQGITYDNQREIAKPDYATIRIGSFYSSLVLSTAISYRYTSSSGSGTAFVFDNEIGDIRKDGTDFPLLIALDSRNYMIITRNMDLDASLRASYRHYPLDTQEDSFSLTLPLEGMRGNFTTGYRVTRFINGNIYDRFLWLTDFVDTRGEEDRTGGRRFERIDNVVGSDLIWLMGPDRNVGLGVDRRDVIVLENEEEFGNQERVEYQERVYYEQRILESIIVGARAVFTQRDYDITNRLDTTQQDYSLFIRGSEEGIAGVRISDASTLTASVGASVGATSSDSSSNRRGPIAVPDITNADGSTTRQRSFNDSETTALTALIELYTQLYKDLAHALTYETGLRGGFDTEFEEYDRYEYQLFLEREGVGFEIYSYLESVEPTSTSQNAYDSWVTGIRIDYPIFGFLTLDGNLEHAARNNKNTVDGARLENSEDYVTRSARIGTTVGIMQEVNFNVYFERLERLSDNDDLEFDRNTVQATLSWSKPL
jgi:hypothetical protein